MPCFENVLNSFSFDQCACEHCAKFFRAQAWLEAFHVHSAGEIKQLFLWKTADAKCFCCLFRQNQQKISKFVLLYKTLSLEQQSIFPPLNRRTMLRWFGCFRLHDLLFATIAVPRWDLNNRGN